MAFFALCLDRRWWWWWWRKRW